MCNNKEEFNNEMMQQGIFIQNRDASWELVPNAFAELLFRHSTCNAKQCKCRAGRHKNLENTKWEIILCKCCGSQGIHVECGQQLHELRKGGKSWQCYSCIEILRKHPGNIAKDISGILMNDRGEELPIPGSSNTTSDCKQSPSKEEYIRKRQRLPTDSENLVLDKRKCNASPCEEIIDVENIDTEMLSKEVLLMKEKAKSTSDYDSRFLDKYDIHEFCGEKNEYKNKHQIDRNEIVILSSDSEYDVIHSCDSESQSDEEDDEIQEKYVVFKMNKILPYLETYKGRDKILRLFCYATKFIAGSLESPELISQFDNFSSQLSTSRACFRLLDDIPTIADIASNISKERGLLALSKVEIFESIVDIIFCPLDHISWAIDHRIIRTENSIWSTASTMCWVISLYISIYKTLMKMADISNQKFNLESDASNREEIKRLKKRQWTLQLSIMKCLFDVLFAVSYLPKGMLWAKFFNKRGVGLLGTLSSLISLYQAFLM
ncbi:hypothetical protein RUM44_012640 [Polyplax serrata]|uniref:PHF7/G2E3-like PHD zinc finger domain-containing protein n=1 Tax=Polyplax serrata TaxID=468196 RepID=A0ABR1BC88_POLSC